MPDFNFALLRLESVNHVTDLFAFAGRHRLNRHIDNVVQMIHEDLHLGAHPWLDPVISAVDRDGGDVNLEVGIHPTVLRIRQHTHLGDLTVQDCVRESVHCDANFFALLDLLDVGFVDFHLHGHPGHVGDGDNGLTFAHGSAFADRFLVPIIIHLFAATTVNHKTGLLRLQDAFFELFVEVFSLANLDVVLALGGLQLRVGLGELGNGRFPGAFEFARGLGIFRQRLFGRFLEFVFQEQVASRVRCLHLQARVFKSNLVAFQVYFRDETLFEEPLGAFQRGFGLAQLLLRHLQVVFKLANFLFRFTVAERLDLRVLGKINQDGHRWRVGL